MLGFIDDVLIAGARVPSTYSTSGCWDVLPVGAGVPR